MKRILIISSVLSIFFTFAQATISVQAANSEFYITQSFQAILDREPTTEELNYWQGKNSQDLGALDASGYVNIRKRINAAAERPVVINDIYLRALKRNARKDERQALMNFIAPTNHIRKQLFISNERKAAIEGIYVDILGRKPKQADLNFYYLTRSDISDITDILLVSTERTLMINTLSQRILGRKATAEELKMFNTNKPNRTGAQWNYYYRDDISKYFLNLRARGLVVSPTSLTINEGESAEFTVQLYTKPQAKVQLSLSVNADSAQLDLSSSALTFTPDNWDKPQTVVATVSAVNGEEDTEGVITVTYSNLGSVEIAVDIIAAVPLTIPFGSVITPYVAEADVASIPEAFSLDENNPYWGFRHPGVDFMITKDSIPVRAVVDGQIEGLTIAKENNQMGWHAGFCIAHGENGACYNLETFSQSDSIGTRQTENLFFASGDTVSQGEVIANLIFGGDGAHIDFGITVPGNRVCPEPYFTAEAKESILRLMHKDHPDWPICAD